MKHTLLLEFCRNLKITLIPLLMTGLSYCTSAQDKLYPNTFPLGDVKLLNGPFKSAQDLNITTLLKYNVDRLLAPYRKEAGLSVKGSSYQNWIGLDGHIGGHFLSSLALAYAATGNAQCKQRMDYMITELKACQDAQKGDANFLGYLGGVPNGKAMWLKVKNGNPGAVADNWVPWYNLHKMYAGLRDVWLYTGNANARTMFLSFCDWGITICSKLSDAQMETMMDTEHGGINEVYADAYQMTNDSKYLNMAKKFSHKMLLNPMSSKVDNLDNKHANTQVPKAVGFQRIAELNKENNYSVASRFFWETVTGKRSLAFGGNSRKEFFPQASACGDYLTDREGPESCNSNNMLKLAEGLFRMKPEARFADFYERTVFNHILSTQHPTHGGYVYFTPARPQHYRVYSAPNSAMWCCVGTGMENHGKYGQFIYTHRNDSLYVNLFIASELNWKANGVQIKQETTFPNEQQTKLTITSTSQNFKLFVRHPSWVPNGALKIAVGTDTLSIASTSSSYVQINKALKTGDVVTVILPMRTTLEQLPNVPNYFAIMHGPIMLAAKTGTQDLAGLVADDSRWGHIANGSLVALNTAPVIISDRNSVPLKVKKVNNLPFTFKLPVLIASKPDSILLEPFYKIHDARYTMYWMSLTSAQYKRIIDSLTLVENKNLELDRRTVDKVTPGQQQPEVDHTLKSSNSTSNVWQNEFYRDASSGGYFSYSLLTKKETGLSLMVRYWGNETLPRTFDIQVDGVRLITENITGKWNRDEFVNVEYPLPNSMVQGKDSIRVRFVASGNNYAGGVFDVRILRKDGVVTGLEDAKEFETILYPNPTTGIINIQCNNSLKGPYTIEVRDILGNSVFVGTKITGENSFQLDLSEYPAGIYTILTLSDQRQYHLKVVKHK